MPPPETTAAPTAPSAPTAAPAATTPPAAAPTGKVKLTRAELVAKLTSRQPDADTGAPQGTSPSATEGVAPDGSAPVPGDAKQPGESQRQYEHRIAQAMLSAQRHERDALTHKRTAETASARVRELETLLESLAADPVKALAHAKSDPVTLAQLMLDGKLKAGDPQPKFDLPPEVQRLIEQGRAAEAKAAQDALAAQAAEDRAHNVKLVDQARIAHVEQFPVLAAIPADGLLTIYEHIAAERGAEPDFVEVAELAQKRVLSDLTHFLSDDGVLKLLPGEVKSKLAKVLGPTQAERTDTQQQAPAERVQGQIAPSTITNRDVSRVPSRDDRKRLSSRELAEKLQQQALGK